MFVFEALLGALFQFLGELALQVLGEILFELGLHSIKEPFRASPDPRIAAIGYGLGGAIFGGLSLLAMPTHLVGTPAARKPRCHAFGRGILHRPGRPHTSALRRHAASD